MKVLYGPRYSISESSVVAFGKFDGLHTGHMKIIETVLNEARINGLKSIIYTFDEHPGNVLKNENIVLLTSNKEKEEILRKIGIDILVFEKFDKEYANIESEDFVREILVNKLKMKRLVMGTNSTFGRESKGNIETMRKLSNKYGFELIEVDLVHEDGKVISSTNIRKYEKFNKHNFQETLDGLDRSRA